MTRGLFFCAIACSIAAPAIAGERAATVPASWVLPTLILPVADRAPVFGLLATRGDFSIAIDTKAVPVMTLAAFEEQMPHVTTVSIADRDAAVQVSPYATPSLRSLAAWRLTGRIVPVTATANGFYAVRDMLGDYRKPRVFRPSALSATLMLRIDGKDDTPTLGVGGGGVAAALWRVRPQ
ncbi:MAG: hypothetical protein EOP60_17300 [Sphingomonadales bacterium]|nr:MAG: hypothetical protein EOP60_17300 [Sphingomonadales bacterium]